MVENNVSEDGTVLLEYLPKLIRLAERNMSSRLRQKLGADDMAHSILGSVVRMTREEKLPIGVQQSDDFWRYLVVVSLFKIRKKARFYAAGKRQSSLEVPLQDIEYLIQEQGDPSDEGASRVAAVLEKLQEGMTEDERIILAGKIDGKSNAEIAEALNGGQGRSTKTVTRRWKSIESKIKKIVEESEI